MKDYPLYYKELLSELKILKQDIPETIKGFGLLHKAATSEGTLSTKNKELIALGISICVHCDACITSHVKDVLRAGASSEEIVETIGVAIMMGGGPALMYGCEALAALRQFQEKAKPKPVLKDQYEPQVRG